MLPPYTICVLTSKARKAWDGLPPSLREQVEEDLRLYQKKDPRYPKAREHIEGKIAGKNRRCHWEYKRLPGAWRMLYTVNESDRMIEVEYLGEHPK